MRKLSKEMTTMNWQTQHHIEVLFDLLCFLPNKLVLIKKMALIICLVSWLNLRKLKCMAQQRIFRYLRGSSNLKIVYRKQEDPILWEASYANWSGGQDDQKPTTGFFYVWPAHCCHLMASEKATNNRAFKL